jgi:2-dehydropantoate 2-reductase
VVNAAVNPVAALAGRRNGDIMTFPYLRRLAFSVAQEAAAVAKACGVELGDEFDPLHAVREVCELTATNRCSMLQDLEVGRQTEIEQINGEIARRASVDVPAPLCEALTVLIKAAQGWKEAE